MNKQLKRAIVEFIFDNESHFQLPNETTDKFRPYIFDTKGEYLIGGADVADFIRRAIKLIRE